MANTLAVQIWQALPQTQCQRCSYVDCAAYAEAVANGAAGINQCPPGGDEGVQRLASITGQSVVPIAPEFGQPQERTVAYVDEDWCIGCTLCVKACPVDAIVGSNKTMHTVLETRCTGCELCIPACPVDCIELAIVTPGKTGWQAWTQLEADTARAHYAEHQQRVAAQAANKKSEKLAELEYKASHLAAVSKIQDAQILEQKQAAVAAAIARARAQREAT